MSSRGIIGFVWSIVVLAGPISARAADPVVTLERWAGPGDLVSGHGMGADVFLLVAEATWDRSASRLPARYALRITMPEGRVETRPYPVENPPGSRRFPVYLTAGPFRNLTPAAAKFAIEVVDASTGAVLSNALAGSIVDLPRPRGDVTAIDAGPFGRGAPLASADPYLPDAGPDGFVFAKVPGLPGFFIATTEATVKQVAARLPGYDPKAKRSDEFTLEDPAQPAINLTANTSAEYLRSLAKADPAEVPFRLPTRDEWLAAARGGKTSAFWWGDEPTYPAGANLLGPEPALPGDSTAPSLPREAAPTFAANPFGLYHTFGNAAEWATVPAGGFARMGGHFRTEPATPLPDVATAEGDDLGPDPFVGVRPAFSLTPELGRDLARRKLEALPALREVGVAFDPEKAEITLTGSVTDPSVRRAADRLLADLWFAASVVNRLETSGILPGQLASLGGPAGPAKRTASLGRTFLEVPIAVRWFDPLPVNGSDWWVNIYLPGGGHVAHKLAETEPGRVPRIVAVLDRERLAAAGVRDDAPLTVALSLGAPAPTPADPRLVTNLARVVPSPSPRSR